MPDLEPGVVSGAIQKLVDQHLPGPEDEPQVQIRIDPHPEICEKKREIMQQIALEKLAVKEAKGE